VGEETAEALRDFLKDGLIRNAVNFPSVSAEEFKRLQPFVDLGERLGTFVSQMNDQRITSVGIRYYGEIAQGKTAIVRNAILSGVFKPLLSSGITVVNAAGVAAERGIEVVESHSTRTRNYASLISVRLRSSQGERWVEGAVFEHATPRLVLIDGVRVEAHLEGTMIVTCNTDTPGVIGGVGTVLGKHGINIAQFALGRDGDRAMGIVTVDEPTPIPDVVLGVLATSQAERAARLVAGRFQLD
jgi:D-3-phosphoglycerate dehydrogenase